MRKTSKFLAVLIALSMVLPGIAPVVEAMLLPGIAQAAPVAEEKNVTRLSGDDRILTAIEASKEIYKDGAGSVVLAGFSGEVDALTGTLLAGVKDAPLLLTKETVLSPATKAEIERLKAKTLYIIGGENVVSKEVEAALKKNYTVERVDGANRFETAANVAKKVKGKTASHVFLALGRETIEGDALADALAIGPVSVKENMPVLLTDKNSLPKETKQALVDLGVTHVTILGGTAAVSENVEKELKGYTVDRVKGNNRFETALEIAGQYYEDAENAVLAYGWKSADALVGGYLGAKKNAPILLTDKDKLDEKTENYLKVYSKKAFVLGGTTVVSDLVFKKVEDAVSTIVVSDITIDKSTTLTKNYKTVKVTGNDIIVDLGGKTVQTLTVSGNDTTIKNGKVVNLNIEKQVINVVLEDIVDAENGEHNFAGGGGKSIVLKGKTNLKGTVSITSTTPIQIRAENLVQGNGIKGKITVDTDAAVTIAAPAEEVEVVKENKNIKIDAPVTKIVALANVNITLGKDVEAPTLEKAKGVEASATNSDGKKQDFIENDKLEPTKPVDPKPEPGGGGGSGTIVDVNDIGTLKSALANDKIKTINIKADISNITEALVVNHAVTINGGDKKLSFTAALNTLANGKRQGILVYASGTTINNLSVVMSGKLAEEGFHGWEGVYGIQVYNATGVILNNVTASGADGGILVNASEVKLTGKTTVSGNEFGGIEVSRGKADGLLNSALTVTGTLVNTSEAYGQPTIWLVTLEGAVIGANVPAYTNTTIKADQTQYYLDSENVVDPSKPQTFTATFETTVTKAIGSQGTVDTDYIVQGWETSPNYNYTTDGAFYTLQLVNGDGVLVPFASVFDEFTLQTTGSLNTHKYHSGKRNQADFNGATFEKHNGTAFVSDNGGTLRNTTLNGTLFYGIHSDIYGVNIAANSNIKISINGKIKMDATPASYNLIMKLNQPTRKDKYTLYTFEEFKALIESPLALKEFTLKVN